MESNPSQSCDRPVESGSTTRFVYFDLGNVLVNFSHRRAAEQIARLSGCDFDNVWKVVFEGDLQRRLELGAIDDQQFAVEFNRATGADCDWRELALAGSDIFWLNANVIPIIAQLATANWPIGILSNTCAAHWRHVINRFPIIAQLASTTVLSFKVGAMKPDPAIYAAAIEQAGCRAAEIFFVDDRDENVAAARKSGIDAEIFSGATDLAQFLINRQIKINY